MEVVLVDNIRSPVFHREDKRWLREDHRSLEISYDRMFFSPTPGDLFLSKNALLYLSNPTKLPTERH